MRISQDINYAFRKLRRTPSFSAICVCVIALGMTISLVTFSFVYQFNFKSPDFPDGNRFVVLETFDRNTGQEGSVRRLNDYGFKLIKNANAGFEEIGAFTVFNATLSDGEFSDLFKAVQVTPDILSATQVVPLLGRNLSRDDSLPGAEQVAVIKAKVWRQYYNSNPDIIGHTSRINGNFYTIVGVLPDNFAFPDLIQDVWLPLSIPNAASPEQVGYLGIIGKLKAGQSKQASTLVINQILDRLHSEYPEGPYAYRTEVSNHVKLVASDAGGLFTVIVAISIVILALCSVNLATLLFVQANERQQELAIRSAIGASKWQVAKQILIESAILCFIGALFSVALSSLSLVLLRSMLINATSEDFGSIFLSFSIDGPMIGICLLATILIWLLTGSTTAYRISRQDVNAALDGSSKGGTGRTAMAVTKVVIGFEVVLSVFLISLCGVFALGIQDIYQADYGTELENRYVGRFDLSNEVYENPSDRLVYIENLRAELDAQPQILNSAITTTLPSGGGYAFYYTLADRSLEKNNAYPIQSVIWVSDNYFESINKELRTGRTFDFSDTPNSEPSVIVTAPFAETMWPGESPIGKQLILRPDSTAETLTVVGVVEHIEQGAAQSAQSKRPSFYRPIRQSTPQRFQFIVQTEPTVTLADVIKALQTASVNVDRNIPLTEILSLERYYQVSLNVAKPLGNLFTAIAIATLILAVLGIFGVIYRSVNARTVEIGIRRALGSSNLTTSKIFLIQGGIFILIGAIIGGGLSALSSQLMASLISNILEYVPFTLTFTILLIGTLILLASYLPTRKVLAMEPGDALRYD